MSTLHRNARAVQPEPVYSSASEWPAWTDADRYTPDVPGVFLPFEGDEAWFAELTRQSTDPGPSALTDLAWIVEQGADHAARADAEGFDVHGMVACILASLARSLRFARTESAAAYARGQGIDLDAAGQGGAAPRGGLAGELDVEASWYLSRDTDAGRLAAAEVFRAAGLAERMGSATAADYEADEAAWRMAAVEAMG